jgi:drug/metabolite transporter (DMT)-like permease
MKPPARQPLLVVAAGVVFTSFSAIFIRLSSAPPLAIASYRMVFTVVMLAPLLARELIRDRRDRSPTGEHRPIRPRVVMLSLVSGVFLSLHFATWIASLSYTSVASSTVLVTTHPIIVAAVGAAFLGERLRVRSVILICSAFAGGVILVAGGARLEGSAVGNLLAFAGAVAVSGYMILGRVVRQTMSVNRYTFLTYSTAAILLVVYALASRTPLYPYPVRELLLFAALALVCTLLGHSLFNWAIRYVRASVISTSILGEPVIATVLAILLFGEIPAIWTLVGGAVILVSIFFFVRSESEATRAMRRLQRDSRPRPTRGSRP